MWRAWAVAVVAACYAPAAEQSCTLTCEVGASCPGGLVCGMDGMCKRDGDADCRPDAGVDIGVDAGFPNAGLVAWWKLDEGNNLFAGDSSGHAQTGKIHTTINWITGHI